LKFHKHIIPAIPWKKQDQTDDSFVILLGEISAYCIHGNAFCGRVKSLETGRYIMADSHAVAGAGVTRLILNSAIKIPHSAFEMSLLTSAAARFRDRRSDYFQAQPQSHHRAVLTGRHRPPSLPIVPW
jgi:hypothetical protein